MSIKRFDWNSTYEFGIPSIDGQHKKLFSLINEFIVAFETHQPKETLEVLVKEVVAYTHYHLAWEEEMFRMSGYVDAPAHAEQHQWFKEKITDLSTRFFSGEIEMKSELLGVLGSWWATHILEEDRKYVATLLNAGIR